VNGYLDDLPVNKVGAFEQALLASLHADHGDVLKDIAKKQALDDDITGRLKDAIDAFAKGFE